jgi:1,4-dihydroxy-2-naphthoate octaprenyltransferase
MSAAHVASRHDLASDNARFWRGVWRIADPKITLASVGSLFLGVCAAAHDGPLRARWVVLTVLGIFLIEVAKGASGEIFDWDSGTDARVTPEDRSPFSGGKRVLVDQLMTRAQTRRVATLAYALGAMCGAVIALHEPGVLWLGLAGAALAYFYHAPPLKLAYRGFGEVAVLFAYGPMIACGSYLVQRGDVGKTVVHLGVVYGIVVAAFLFINEFPDANADASSGKRTWVVRLGNKRASRVFAAFPLVAFGYLAALPVLAGVTPAVWLGMLGLPLAACAAWKLSRSYQTTADIVPAQAWTLLSFILMALGSGIGLLL